MSNREIIIVGAGSAGCILAHLLACRGIRVTLIEAPSTAAAEIDRQRPARWLNLLGSSDDWDFATAKNAPLAGRTLKWPRGRGLGGSSRINAMIWFPPTDADLASVAATSNWSVEQLRAAFVDIESIVKPETPRWLSQSTLRFLAAADQQSDGQPMVYRRVNRNGRRWNPAELLNDSNVEVVRATVDRVVFSDNRTTGVELIGGETLTGSKVVLCSGTIGSPAILMRSGIGRADVLSKANIDVRFESSNVGGNLQDHLTMPVILAVDGSRKFDSQPTMRELAQWQVAGSGPLSSNIAECGGLFADDEIQIHVTPTHYLTFPNPNAPAAMTIAVNATHPSSRGNVTIESADPSTAPRIEPNYLGDESDLKTLIAGVRLARELAEREPLKDWAERELLPGTKRASDEAIGKAIGRYAQTLYHPVGTCAIGSVVDDQLSVQGVENLQVADASVLPRLTTGNPNAMVMTIAKLASELL